MASHSAFCRAYRPKNVAKMPFNPQNRTFSSKFTIKIPEFAETNATRVSAQGILPLKDIRWTFFWSFKKVETGPRIGGARAVSRPKPDVKRRKLALVEALVVIRYDPDCMPDR